MLPTALVRFAPHVEQLKKNFGAIGDMRLIGEMYHPQIAFLCIGDLYTMGPEQAAKAMTPVTERIATVRTRRCGRVTSAPTLRLGEQLVHRAAAETARVHFDLGEAGDVRRIVAPHVQRHPRA